MTNEKNVLLGKRGRKATTSDQGDGQPAPQLRRSRAKRWPSLSKDTTPLNPTVFEYKPRIGLRTPEMTTLIAEQITPSPQSSKGHMSSQDIFDFMSLPTELRLHVYHMALVRAEPIQLHTVRPEAAEPEAPTNSQEIKPGTLHVSNSTMTDPVTRRRTTDPPPAPLVPPADPLVPVILRLNKQINREARQLLYAENTFQLNLSSGNHTLSTLHQRSRSLIKHVVLTIPSHHDILDGFADLVRLGLRYCWGLKSFRIILAASLPDDNRGGGASSVHANAFHILRWLPRGCSVVLEGCVNENVRRVVVEEGRLMNCLDERSYLKRQHQMPERH